VLLIAGGYAEATAGELTSWQERHAVLVLSKAKVGVVVSPDLVSPLNPSAICEKFVKC
jgi:hypothetical protein